MSQPTCDIAILGATPLGALLAGLLAKNHGKRVVLVGSTPSGFRLPRRFDLSLAPMTRPAAWAHLTAALPETLKLVRQARARAALDRLDPVLVAATGPGADALGHIAHMAQGFGHAVEPYRGRDLGEGERGLRLRDAVLLARPALDPLLATWLTRLGVLRLPAEATTLAADGPGGVLTGPDGPVTAARLVFVSDAAILRHLGPDPAPHLLRPQPHLSVLTEPTQRLFAPLVIYLETGIMLHQLPTGGILALAPGRTEDALHTLGDLLPGPGSLRRAGQAVHRELVSRDGAPVLGPLAPDGPTLLAGLGLAGAFLAPALARWLAAAADPDEAAYFGAHAPGAGRAALADLAPMPQPDSVPA